MGSIHEKNQGPKISCYCTFKDDLGEMTMILLSVCLLTDGASPAKPIQAE
jgi:hypothetical protein